MVLNKFINNYAYIIIIFKYNMDLSPKKKGIMI